jgi:sugar (pentulose or hexulose) kinase
MLCLGIDSGTTSTRTLVLDVKSGKIVAFAQKRTRRLPIRRGDRSLLSPAWSDVILLVR